MSRHLLLFFVAALTFTSGVSAQRMYKSVGPDGKVTFSDIPPIETASKITVIRKGSKPQPEKKFADETENSTVDLYAADAAGQNQRWIDLRSRSTSMFARGDYDGVIRVEKAAMEIARKNSPSDPRIVASMHALGSAHQALGNYAQSIALFERAISMSKGGPPYARADELYRELVAAHLTVAKLRIESESAAYSAAARERVENENAYAEGTKKRP
ncbi:tetratricopeptide repeat protein [Massilia glaciei]|uniref:DUF4124 domain-containing protein n=1 Tax=Massilia glaciei TaxID=1524097 RepID=A0A2U2H966_9BURK|nr:tetratricopeptide repeat protein [Massilia glaciei]PWF39132.1 DUF4124 domain-containing protein [Massilia glaciei]